MSFDLIWQGVTAIALFSMRYSKHGWYSPSTKIVVFVKVRNYKQLGKLETEFTIHLVT